MQNKDVVASAGVADATSLCTFFDMQGSSIFCTEDDIFGETLSNDEALYASDGELVQPSEIIARRFEY